METANRSLLHMPFSTPLIQCHSLCLYRSDTWQNRTHSFLPHSFLFHAIDLLLSCSLSLSLSHSLCGYHVTHAELDGCKGCWSLWPLWSLWFRLPSFSPSLVSLRLSFSLSRSQIQNFSIPPLWHIRIALIGRMIGAWVGCGLPRCSSPKFPLPIRLPTLKLGPKSITPSSMDCIRHQGERERERGRDTKRWWLSVG